MNGTVTSAEPVIVHGTIVGEVVSMNGSVLVEGDGRIDGTVTAREVSVRGTCVGRLVGTEVVRLHPGSQVRADIASVKLAMEDGAIFTGRVEPARAEAAARVTAYRQTPAPVESGSPSGSS